jgi:hypothetical protein
MTRAPRPDVSTALDGDEVFEMPDRERPRCLVARQEEHRDRVVSRRRQVDLAIGGPGPKKAIWDLDQASGAVAHQRIGAYRAPVVEVYEDLEALRDDVVGLPTAHVGDEADAAGVVLVPRVVQPLSWRLLHHVILPSFLAAMPGNGPPGPRRTQTYADSLREKRIPRAYGKGGWQLPGPLAGRPRLHPPSTRRRRRATGRLVSRRRRPFRRDPSSRESRRQVDRPVDWRHVPPPLRRSRYGGHPARRSRRRGIRRMPAR